LVYFLALSIKEAEIVYKNWEKINQKKLASNHRVNEEQALHPIR